MSPSPTDPVWQLAASFVDHLTCLAQELLQESGPYVTGFRGLGKISGSWVESVNETVARVRLDRHSIDEQLIDAIDQYEEHVHFAINKLRRNPTASDSQTNLRFLADFCCQLRNKICDVYSLPKPTRSLPSGDPVDKEVAVVTTDLVGYTMRARQSTDLIRQQQGVSASLNTVEQLDRTILDQLRNAFCTALPREPWLKHRLRSTGDGVILWFDSVQDALRFAGEVHVAANEYNSAQRPNTPYRHRVGIAYGDVRFGADGAGEDRQRVFHGIPLIEAVRMEACAPAGGIAVHERAWSKLAVECPEGTNPGIDTFRAEFQDHPRLEPKQGEVYRGWVRPASLLDQASH